MRILAVDWSGRDAREGAGHIGLAEATGGVLTRVVGGLSRPAAFEEIVRSLDAGTDVAVALDFAFSLPEGFARRHGATTMRDVWRVVEEHGERWRRDRTPPFWGRSGRPVEAREDEPFRRTDRETSSVSGIRPKSVFQVDGAGTVGTGSLRGLPFLLRLEDAGFNVWPLRSGLPLVVEIWPRILTGPVVKSDHAGRIAYLAQFALPRDLADGAAASEDSFDAAVSAIVLSRAEHELRSLRPEPAYELEGKVFVGLARGRGARFSACGPETSIPCGPPIRRRGARRSRADRSRRDGPC